MPNVKSLCLKLGSQCTTLLISWSINGLSVERGIQGHPDVICFSAPVIILIVQRIRTQELNIFNNVTIENELEWRLNDDNIQTGLATHTKANTVINDGEKYTSKERYHEITAKFKTISRALRFSNQYFTIERARDFLKISNCRSSDLLVQIDPFFRQILVRTVVVFTRPAISTRQ